VEAIVNHTHTQSPEDIAQNAFTFQDRLRAGFAALGWTAHLGDYEDTFTIVDPFNESTLALFAGCPDLDEIPCWCEFTSSFKGELESVSLDSPSVRAALELVWRCLDASTAASS
jgi:hypothetical protein